MRNGQDMARISSRTEVWRDLYEQQARDAAFLWHLRSVAVHQPDYRPAHLARLERRIDNHLNALMHGADLAWDVCSEELSWKQAGEAFTAATIAFHRDNPNHIARALAAGLVNGNTFRGLASAVAWLPERGARAWTQKFLESPNLDHLHLAIAACGLRAHDPAGDLARLLQRDDCRAHTPLFARCLRVAGIFKRADLAGAVEAATDATDAEVRFWALWSSVLLGGRDRAHELKPYVTTDNAWRRPAMQLAFRVLPTKTARAWIDELAPHAAQARHALTATGVLGDPDPMPRLIDAMQDPLLARLAGEAFTTLTGRDLIRDGLARERPPVSIDLLDEQDPGVILDDEKLPWPDPDAVALAWKRSAADYRPGERYFLGQAITPAHLHGVLAHGHQRQRHAAALELALRDASLPLPNTCAKQAAP